MTRSHTAREAIKLELRRRGISYIDIEREHGLHNSQISRCLNAEGRFELGMLENLASICGYHLEIALVKREDEE